MTNAVSISPRDMLLNKTLKDGWLLVERLDKKAGDSGGNFGTGYRATRGEGELAFVKAIDYVAALRDKNIAAKLLQITREFEFEREVLDFCTKRGMSKVLRFYGHDEISADGSDNPLMKVSCLIMEAGEKDLRRLVLNSGAGAGAGCAWNLFIVSDIALAVSQLHSSGIAHHDVKPSNVIATKPSGKVNHQEAAPSPAGGISARQEVKVGDLGRVLRRDQDGPFNGEGFAGDPRYKPLESIYGHVPVDWVDSREAADAYMVGSLVVFLFAGASLQNLIGQYIQPKFYPANYRQYDQPLLDILKDATIRALHEHLRPTLPVAFVDEVMAIALSLTHPDPMQRGDPKSRKQLGRPVGMDRIHQRLLLLARRCAAHERGRSAA